jgi:hypothetical protein
MINGAVEILAKIPSAFLDPFLLAASQKEEMRGFIVVGYQSAVFGGLFDVLFLRGPEIHECVMLARDYREKTSLDDVRARFKLLPQKNRALVHLFSAEQQLVQKFLTTVRTEPIVKLNVETLSKKQILKITRSLECPKTLAERNLFGEELPIIELHELDPRTDSLAFQLGFRCGGFVLYDPERIWFPPGPVSAAHDRAQIELPFENRSHSAVLVQAKQKPPAAKQSTELDVPLLPARGVLSKTFEDLWRLAMHQVSAVTGRSSGHFLEECTAPIRRKNPRFAPGSLDDASAPLVLDFLADIAAHAPFFKRTRIRKIVLSLVAQLYNQQYDLLEKSGLLQKVETLYYSLSPKS